MTLEDLHERHFHELETSRLLMRPVRLEDAEAMFAFTSFPDNFRYIRSSVHQSLDESRDYLQRVLDGYQRHIQFFWGICLKDSGRMVGTCRLHSFHEKELSMETSYMIHQDYSGQGIGRETEKRLVQYSFEELGLSAVYTRCTTENIESARLIENSGLKKIKTLIHDAQFHDIWYDFYLFKITKGEWMT